MPLNRPVNHPSIRRSACISPTRQSPIEPRRDSPSLPPPEALSPSFPFLRPGGPRPRPLRASVPWTHAEPASLQKKKLASSKHTDIKSFHFGPPPPAAVPLLALSPRRARRSRPVTKTISASASADLPCLPRIACARARDRWHGVNTPLLTPLPPRIAPCRATGARHRSSALARHIPSRPPFPTLTTEGGDGEVL
jgi:hypothetical protein